MTTNAQIFRVIGLQDDGMRVTLATHLIGQQARAVITALSKGAHGPAFAEMLIEPQPDSTGEIPVRKL